MTRTHYHGWSAVNYNNQIKRNFANKGKFKSKGYKPQRPTFLAFSVKKRYACSTQMSFNYSFNNYFNGIIKGDKEILVTQVLHSKTL